MDCGRFVARSDRRGVHQPSLRREYNSDPISVISFLHGSGSFPFRDLGLLHSEDGPLCGLFRLEHFAVSRLARHTLVRQSLLLVDAMGENLFLHDRVGGKSRRVASDLSEFTQRQSARRVTR